MKKLLLLFVVFLLPMVVSAHDIEVINPYGVTIYYNYINGGKELEVTFFGEIYNTSAVYGETVAIPEEVNYKNQKLKVTRIGDYAFSGCIYLQGIIIPQSITSIGKHAFYYCYMLPSITIPNSVMSLGEGAFTTCAKIKSINIPNGVTSIENSLFLNCSNLTSVSIPNSVTSIGDYSFNGCI